MSGYGNITMNIRKNKIKSRLKAGEIATVVSGITDSDDIDSFGQIASEVGIDGVWLEGEHGSVDAADLGNLTRACDIWGLSSVVRVNDNHQGLIYRTLDRGAQTIVVPHINTRLEAVNVVQGAKFSPVGSRGLYTSRQYYGVKDFTAIGNEETCLIVLIEDIVAYEYLDEILKVDHIDVFFVAPADFASSMGHIGNPSHPEVQQKIKSSISRIIKAGKNAGTLVTNQNIDEYTSIGVKLFLSGVQGWVEKGAREFTAKARA